MYSLKAQDGTVVLNKDDEFGRNVIGVVCRYQIFNDRKSVDIFVVPGGDYALAEENCDLELSLRVLERHSQSHTRPTAHWR